MNKLTLLLNFFIFYTINISIAQSNIDAEIRWGDPINMKRKEVGPNPIGISNNTFYATKRKKDKKYIQQYDLNKLSLKSEYLLNLKYNGKQLNIVNKFVFGENVVFITYYIDKKKKKKHYLIQALGKGGNLLKPIELAEVAWSKKKIIITKSAAKKIINSGAYSFRSIVSDNSKSLMITYRTDSKKDGLITILLDESMEIINKGKYRIPFDDYRNVRSKLSDNGVLYSIGFEFEKIEKKGILKSSKIKITNYHLLAYNAAEGEMETFDVLLDKEIKSINLKIMENETIIVYGMCSNKGESGVTGSFFIKKNSSDNTDFTVFNEFESNFITQYWTPRQKKKAEKKKKKNKKKSEPALYNYILHKLAVKDNGDMVLLAEQYYMYVTSQTHTDANGHSYKTYTKHYIYNDIIAVNCTNTGEITWNNKIKKRQYSINDRGYYSSFFTMVQDNNLFLIYNDKEANMDETSLADKKKRKAKKNTVAAIISINDEGNVSKNTLFDFEGDLARTLIPKRCRKMSDNEMLIYTNGRKKTKIFGWVTL